MIDHDRLLELLDYNPTTGVFTRRVALSNAVKVGDIAGSLVRGYVVISVDGDDYLAHHLAWFWTYKVWPKTGVDHKDLQKHHNAIDNLREANQSQNGANNKIRKHNTCGFKGVTKHGHKFKAAITVNRKRVHLGVFEHPADAAKAYDDNSVKYFGPFALTNRQQGLLP